MSHQSRSLVRLPLFPCVALVACSSTAIPDTTPRLTLTTTVHDTTVPQGGRFGLPYVLTWYNQSGDSVLITLDNRPPNISADLATSTQRTVGNTATGVITVTVGFLDPGTYTIDLVSQGAMHSLVSIPITIHVTLTQ